MQANDTTSANKWANWLTNSLEMQEKQTVRKRQSAFGLLMILSFTQPQRTVHQKKNNS